MLPISMTEQAALLITICFSFLILGFTQTLNKERNFLKIIGLGFLVPLSLCLFLLFNKSIIVPARMLLYIDFSLLGIIFLLVLFWYAKRSYVISVMLILIFPVTVILAGWYGKALPSLFLLYYIQAAIVGVLTILTILTLRKYNQKNDPRFISGLLLLGIGQIMQLLLPQGMLFVGVAVKFLAYLLLTYYVINNIQVSLMRRLAKAESKLLDLDKTINFEVKKKMIPIEQHNEHLQNMIMIDNLTNAYTKKFILDTIEKGIEAPSKEGFTVIMFDIDNFKILNDTQGHLAGDFILKKIATIARSSIRNLDILGRYGGDEFIVVLPGINATEAIFVAERFRKKVKEADLNISVSIGVASYPEDAKTIGELIEIADAGLYHSKKIGRNAVTHYTQTIFSGDSALKNNQ